MRRLVLAYLRDEGVAAAQSGRPRQAESFLQRALALDGADAGLWALLGSVVEGPARLACARQALSRDPQNAQALALMEGEGAGDDAFHLPAPRLRGGAAAISLSQPRAPAIALPRLRLPDLPSISPRGWARIAGALLLLLALGLNVAVASAYGSRYANRFFPGVRIAGLDVSGKTAVEARRLLQEEVAPLLGRPLVVRHGGQTWSIGAGQAGLGYRVEEAVTEALALGRPDSPWSAWFERLRLALWGQDVPLAAEVRAEQLAAFVSQVVAALDRPAVSPAVSCQEDGWAVLPGQDGLRVDRNALEQRLMARLSALARGDAPADGSPLLVAVPLVTETAALSASDALWLRQQLDRVAQPLTLNCAEHSWTAQTADIAAWCSVQLASPPGPVTVQFDSAAAEVYLAALAAEVEVPVQPPRLERQGDRIVTFEPGRDGRRMDVAAAVAQVGRVFRQRLGGEVVDTVDLTVTVVPAGNDATVAALGIADLIGQGHSSFVGSPWNRANNIVVGGREVHGRLVAPDEVFSLNDALDPVTWEKGYVMSEIINAGQVGWGLGGGLCQVATTLYRAALNAGLPIVERTPHLWRLDWYEQDSPPGFDATIMIGGPDFKFRNTTGHYILIQVETNAEESWQVARFYGTDPGWEVSFSEPLVYNGGHSVSFERTVTRDGVVLIQETIYSNYQ